MPKRYPVQEGIKGRKYEPKSPHILTPQKIKHQLARTSELNKCKGSRNDVKARKKQIQTEWSMHKGPEHHLLVPNQYMGGGSRVKAFKGCGLAMGRKWGLLWGSHSSFFGRNVLLGWQLTQKK